ADVAVAIRRRISNPPVSQVGFGIVSSGVPDRGPSGFPGIAGPGFMARLARRWDGVEAPNFLPGLRLKRSNVAADRAVAARGAHDHLILDDQRRVRDGIAVLGGTDSHVP